MTHRRLSLAFVLLAGTAMAAEPVRVATLLPYVADALGKTGGNVTLVATVRTDMRTPPPPPTVDLGSPHAPSFEALAEARPQIIVGDRMMHGALKEKLERSGAEVLLIDSDTVAATFDGLLEVGRRCGVADAMQKQVDESRKQLASQALGKPMPVLILFGTPGSFLVVSPRTWLGDLATSLAFQNVAASVSGQERHPGFVQVSDEVLAGLRPELVLMVAHGDPEAIRTSFTKRLDSGGAWEPMRKTATRGVHVLPASLFSTNPGLALPDAARQLHELAESRVSAR
ncbi:MAG TPA: ABC transporter substrate-binding protein [Candidatus Binatia bacterium]|nr:ABC transporter substrate-binding protein [Candidatus Binatia bacterium]